MKRATPRGYCAIRATCFNPLEGFELFETIQDALKAQQASGFNPLEGFELFETASIEGAAQSPVGVSIP